MNKYSPVRLLPVQLQILSVIQYIHFDWLT